MKYTHTDTGHPIENKYPKLVRDRIPELIQSQGKQVKTRMLDDEEYLKYLLVKLIEESTELLEAQDDEHKHEELADVFEVLESILGTMNITREDISKVQQTKRDIRGGFKDKILMLDQPES